MLGVLNLSAHRVYQSASHSPVLVRRDRSSGGGAVQKKLRQYGGKNQIQPLRKTDGRSRTLE
jgi:hypothetical protein